MGRPAAPPAQSAHLLPVVRMTFHPCWFDLLGEVGLQTVNVAVSHHHQHTLWVDDETRGPEGNAPFLDGTARAVEQHGEWQVAPFPPFLLDRGKFRVQFGQALHGVVMKRKYLEAVALVLLVEIDESRQTARSARASPESPELDEHPLPLEIRDLLLALGQTTRLRHYPIR